MPHGTDINKRDKYGRKLIPKLPWLPFAGRDNEPQPSWMIDQ